MRIVGLFKQLLRVTAQAQFLVVEPCLSSMGACPGHYGSMSIHVTYTCNIHCAQYAFLRARNPNKYIFKATSLFQGILIINLNSSSITAPQDAHQRLVLQLYLGSNSFESSATYVAK